MFQVKNAATTLAVHCAANIRATVLTIDNKQSAKASVTSAGEIVVATPGRLAKAVQDGIVPAAELAASLKVRSPL
jgi:ATP-dependent RNA helicase DDX56/DBP9